MTDLPLVWIVLGIVLLIAVLSYRSARRKRSYDSRAGRGDVDADLLQACRGDRALAERLIARELSENNDLSRTGAALMALAKLRDDQR